ncbi:MAG TPA: hypothetical protein VFZ61_28795, partial [Polyangiales bacterium]
MPKHPLLERLLAEQRITAPQRDAVLAYMSANQCRVEDALIETGTLEEDLLLKWLAALYKTRFVSTEKLAKAEIERGLLTMVPRALAERSVVFPVMFDASDRSLALVVIDPTQVEVQRDVQVAANVKQVKAYVARPAAIRAAINKHYGGDIHAFGKIRTLQNRDLANLFDSYERNVIDGERLSVPNTLSRASDAFDGPPTSSMPSMPSA